MGLYHIPQKSTLRLFYSIAAIVWRAIRARAWISSFNANASAEQAPGIAVTLYWTAPLD